MARRFLNAAWAVLTALAGIIAAWWTVDRWRRGRYDKDASAAENEAAKVREAGKRGDADAVLDSFRRATNKPNPGSNVPK